MGGGYQRGTLTLYLRELTVEALWEPELLSPSSSEVETSSSFNFCVNRCQVGNMDFHLRLSGTTQLTVTHHFSYWGSARGSHLMQMIKLISGVS